MDYYEWRNAVFNQPIRDLADADYESDAFNLSLDEAFEYIDRALMDDGLYSFKEEQLVIGFSRIASNILKKMDHNQNQIRTLEKLRDNLLPKLMSGEV